MTTTAIPYTFGGFNLNDLATYYVDGIDLSPPPINPTTVQIARNAGVKKTGEVVGEKKLSLIVSVISPDGTRAGLRVALDALFLALDKRQQRLVVQDDGRYMIGDCVNKQALIKDPAFVALQCDFECYQPYAYAASPSTATIAGVLTGGGPYSISGTIAGGGTQTAFPQIAITNTSADTLSLLTLTNVTQNASITTSGLTVAPGDVVTIQCDPAAANNLGWTITKNGITSVLYDFIGIFPSQDVGTDTWTITAVTSVGIGAFFVGSSSVGGGGALGGVSPLTISATWTWTPVYLA